MHVLPLPTIFNNFLKIHATEDAQLTNIHKLQILKNIQISLKDHAYICTFF